MNKGILKSLFCLDQFQNFNFRIKIFHIPQLELAYVNANHNKGQDPKEVLLSILEKYQYRVVKNEKFGLLADSQGLPNYVYVHHETDDNLHESKFVSLLQNKEQQDSKDTIH